MPRFRKKPIVIEAIQWTGSNPLDIEKFCNGSALFYKNRQEMTIYTLEGNLVANVDDWIIRGVKNEFYPCKPDIFAATYEPAE